MPAHVVVRNRLVEHFSVSSNPADHLLATSGLLLRGQGTFLPIVNCSISTECRIDSSVCITRFRSLLIYEAADSE